MKWDADKRGGTRIVLKICKCSARFVIASGFFEAIPDLVDPNPRRGDCFVAEQSPLAGKPLLAMASEWLRKFYPRLSASNKLFRNPQSAI
jgi:hypothetical protein